MVNFCHAGADEADVSRLITREATNYEALFQENPKPRPTGKIFKDRLFGPVCRHSGFILPSWLCHTLDVQAMNKTADASLRRRGAANIISSAKVQDARSVTRSARQCGHKNATLPCPGLAWPGLRRSILLRRSTPRAAFPGGPSCSTCTAVKPQPPEACSPEASTLFTPFTFLAMSATCSMAS